MQIITINTDGGARGNPGPAAIGVVMKAGDWSFEYSEYIGDTTNNVAEYTAVLRALEFIRDGKCTPPEFTQIQFMLDSELVVRQIMGIYKVRDTTLQGIYQLIQTILHSQPFTATFTHVPRAQNKRADLLVNFALDSI